MNATHRPTSSNPVRLALLLSAGGLLAACSAPTEGPPSRSTTTAVEPERCTTTTLAGDGTQGYADGPGGPRGTAQLFGPASLALDAAGNLYVADAFDNRIRRIDPSGAVTTVAGNGTQGYADGTGGPDGTAEFNGPWGLAIDDSGNLYVGDLGNNCIRMIDPSGNVSTLAGNGTAGFADGTGGSNGTAEFTSPWGVAVDGAGNVYVADYGNSRIRVIDSSGNVTTLAGNGTFGFADGSGGANGSAELAGPQSIALDAVGNVYVADTFNERIRMVDWSGQVTTIAGNGTAGFADGACGAAEFDSPCSVAVDGEGNVYVSDWGNDRIRKIDPWGTVSTVAGSGADGFADGKCSAAAFHHQEGVAVDRHGKVYVADWGNNRVRAIRR